MECSLCLLEESPFSYEDVVGLIHLSFDERLSQGLHFTCSSMSVDQFREKMSDGLVIVAYEKVSHQLLGTASTHLYKDKDGHLYGYNEYLAVHPSVKHCGIGTLLLNKRLSIMRERGAEYVISDTAVGAKSSVKWHLKNGFVIYGYRSYSSTNYYSYLFRRQLVGRSKWDSRFYRDYHFLVSFLKTRIRYTRMGKERRFWAFLHKII